MLKQIVIHADKGRRQRTVPCLTQKIGGKIAVKSLSKKSPGHRAQGTGHRGRFYVLTIQIDHYTITWVM